MDNIPKELLLEFFLLFSRFEHALKRAGYGKVLDERTNEGVGIDWGRFKRDMQVPNEFWRLDEYVKAERYLLDHPPKRQRWNTQLQKLEWHPSRPTNRSPATVLSQVQTVRNNLFHGGKYPGDIISDPERDEQLLRCCVIFLKICLQLPVLKQWSNLDSNSN